jgi:chemotaxis protein CheC
MQMQGTLEGQMLLAFDDASGLAMADLLLGRAAGTSEEWGELEISAALETMNIAGSAYLNGIARDLSEHGGRRVSLIPTPPTFLRDFAESLLEAAFVEQAAAGRYIVFAKARFELQGNPLKWTFLLVPDPSSLTRLNEILAGSP